MKIDRAVAKQLFLEIGWNSASGKKMGDDAWVQEKLNAVPKNMPDDESEFEDPAAKALAKDICEALESGEEIEFELEGEVEAVSEKPAKGKKGAKTEDKPAKGKKGAKTEEKPAKEKKEKKSSVAKDKFGSRLDSRCAKINAVLSKKPKTIAVITEESGASSVSSHLYTLLKKELIVKSDKGYAIA